MQTQRLCYTQGILLAWFESTSVQKAKSKKKKSHLKSFSNLFLFHFILFYGETFLSWWKRSLPAWLYHIPRAQRLTVWFHEDEMKGNVILCYYSRSPDLNPTNTHVRIWSRVLCTIFVFWKNRDPPGQFQRRVCQDTLLAQLKVAQDLLKKHVPLICPPSVLFPTSYTSDLNQSIALKSWCPAALWVIFVQALLNDMRSIYILWRFIIPVMCLWLKKKVFTVFLQRTLSSCWHPSGLLYVSIVLLVQCLLVVLHIVLCFHCSVIKL